MLICRKWSKKLNQWWLLWKWKNRGRKIHRVNRILKARILESVFMLGLQRKVEIQRLITCLVTCKWKGSFGVVRLNVHWRHKRRQYMMWLLTLERLLTLLASRMMLNFPLSKALKNINSFYYAAVKNSRTTIILKSSSDMKAAKKVILVLS